MATDLSVTIIGAGPVGVVAALAASDAGAHVTLVEQETEVDTSPRAATFHPSTLEMIDALGLWDEFVSVGLVARTFDFWDKAEKRRIARFDHDVLAGETRFPFVVQVEQHKLVRLALRRLEEREGVTVLTGWSFSSLEQDAQGVVCTVGRGGETRTLRSDHLIGCDGGRSQVRKHVGLAFEGYTWPERFLVLTTAADLDDTIDYAYRSYLADPERWTNLFKVSGDDGSGLWRTVYPAHGDGPDEELVTDEYCSTLLADVHPALRPDDLVHRNVYRVHQRVAERFRVGRVFLAGDAAHVNNPIGGLGLNCGIHDAVELVETLAEAHAEGVSEHLLDRYERRRRPLIIEFVQEQTIRNKRRLEASSPADRERWQRELEATCADPDAHRRFVLRSSLLESVQRSKTIV